MKSLRLTWLLAGLFVVTAAVVTPLSAQGRPAAAATVHPHHAKATAHRRAKHRAVARRARRVARRVTRRPH
ncbi:MAG TPA: hypothetical protein VGM77_09390 [Gemmatimonadales bacterium]